MNKEYLKVLKYGLAKDKKLRADDFDDLSTVIIVHDDGSNFHICNAFYEEYKKDWIIVYSEHCGVMVFNKDDLFSVKRYVEEPIPFG